MYLIFDTETTGLPKNFKAPVTDTDNWPRCVQIAWQLHDEWGNLIENKDFLIKPEGYNIPFQAEKIHGISTLLAESMGHSLLDVLKEFNTAIEKSKFVVGQNLDFDLNIMGSEFYRMGIDTLLHQKPVLDTCTETTAALCKIPGGKGGKFKYPTLTELHQHLFNAPFTEAHNATADVEATTRCFFELLRNEVFTIGQLQNSLPYLKEFKSKHPFSIESVGIKHINLKTESERIKSSQIVEDTKDALSNQVTNHNLN